MFKIFLILPFLTNFSVLTKVDRDETQHFFQNSKIYRWQIKSSLNQWFIWLIYEKENKNSDALIEFPTINNKIFQEWFDRRVENSYLFLTEAPKFYLSTADQIPTYKISTFKIFYTSDDTVYPPVPPIPGSNDVLMKLVEFVTLNFYKAITFLWETKIPTTQISLLMPLIVGFLFNLGVQIIYNTPAAGQVGGNLEVAKNKNIEKWRRNVLLASKGGK